MPFCKSCGTQIDENAKFCNSCGAPQKEESVEQRSNVEKLFAVLGYFGFLSVIPAIARKRSDFIRFHVDQGLFNFIIFYLAELSVSLVSETVAAIGKSVLPIYYSLSALLGILGILQLVLLIMGIVNAVNGREEELFLYKLSVFDKLKELVKRIKRDIKDRSDFESFDITEKTVCTLCYLPLLFFLPLVICKKDSEFARFHASHALIANAVCLAGTGAVAALSLLKIVPVFGGIAVAVIGTAVSAVSFGLVAFGAFNAAYGRKNVIPFLKNLKIF
ncbi:MAG: zinc ribbon domain-containing protein [Clostridia bacterium]|nr:zinc ribbon domain-containing protein [Clostridia bacterium]